jgi:hypothetical protein
VATVCFSTAAFHPVQAQPLRVAQGDEGGDEDSEQRPAQPSEPAPSPTEEEAGPPWTYQMARISLLLLVLLVLGMAAVYYRLVVKRQRGEA